MSDDEAKAALQRRYHAATHAMQTGVMYDLEHNAKSGSPKHLRTGVNSALSSHGALAKLLVDKGIVTELEYLTAVCEAMETERDRYAEILSERLGRSIKLG